MSVKNFKNTSNQGFTLIETFVAITILMIAILGPMSMIAKFYADSTYAKNQITAAFLAQDGMETVQNIIKSNAQDRQIMSDDSPTPLTCLDFDAKDWLESLSGYVSGLNVSSLDNSVLSCLSSIYPNGCPLKKNDEGFYVVEALGDTIFTRKIVITLEDPVPTTNYNSDSSVIEATLRRSAKVSSSVWWTEKGVVRGPVTVSSLIIQSQCPL